MQHAKNHLPNSQAGSSPEKTARPWSETVRHLIDVRNTYGETLCGKDKQGRDKTKCMCVATVIRFFPKGRQSKQARVKAKAVLKQRSLRALRPEANLS